MNNTLIQAQTFATHTGASAYTFTGDFLVLLVLIAAFFFFARYVGRGQFVALIISLYAGYALYIAFPFMRFLPNAPHITALTAHTALFGIFVAIAYGILRRVVVSDFLSMGTVGLLILSVLVATFLIALAYHVFSVRTVYTFTPAMNALFAPANLFFWWFSAPLAGLFFFGR